MQINIALVTIIQPDPIRIKISLEPVSLKSAREKARDQPRSEFVEDVPDLTGLTRKMTMTLSQPHDACNGLTAEKGVI